MKLHNDWRKSWRYFSVQAIAALAILPTVWMLLPEDLRASVPDAYKAGLAALIGLAGWIGRIIDQSPRCDENEP